MKTSGSVYVRLGRRLVCGALAASAMVFTAPMAQGQPGGESVVEAREAWRKRDKPRLAAARAAAIAAQHPLASWADYWDMNARLAEATPADVEAFYTRWPGSYVEDRLRNDWLLELGRRRDFTNLAAEYPRFRMNDDRDVACYAVVADHLAGKPVRDAARAAWLAQRDADDGCALMASTLLAAKVFTTADAWLKARHANEINRPRALRQAAALVSDAAGLAAQELVDNPARYLAKRASAVDRSESELTTLALMRLAANEPELAVTAMTERWERVLPPDLAAWAWASIARQAAMKLSPDASELYARAERAGPKTRADVVLPDETLAWKLRAALRANNGKGRWQQVMQAVNAMSADEQRDPAWVYWKARALSALARDSQDGEALRTQGREMLEGIAGQPSFYGALATETLGRVQALPPRPAPLTSEERAGASAHPGLNRALALMGLGLRSEGVREWNYALRGMSDRELLAAAQVACEREIWDRCINTSERTRQEIDVDQRYPMPFRAELVARSRETGVDPAYVYGVIRQESRFILDARSSVGASGLMQLMPATARWTAKKLGLDYSNGQIIDREMNLRLGTGYLKLVLDDFEGSQPMAAAAYNAGPGRPRRWRDGPSMEPAAWAENIPFAETRDYVKKVISNASVYAALLNGQPPQLKTRLGPMIGPRTTGAPVDLP